MKEKLTYCFLKMTKFNQIFLIIILTTLLSCENQNTMNAVISDNLYELNIPIEIKSPNPNETFSVTAYHTFAKTLSNTGISFEDIQDTLKVVIPADQDSISIEVVQMVNEVAKKDTILRASVKDNLCKVRISTHTNETKIHLLHVSADTFLSERTEF